MNSYIDNLPTPFSVLAPMYEVTDTVFRQMVADCARPDLFVTEFVNVDAMQSPGRASAAWRFTYQPSEQPILAQIWGSRPVNFEATARELVAMGYVGVDINMGCPDKSVVKNVCGGGLIREPEKATEIIRATKAGLDGKVPLSVKTRIGFGSYDEAWIRTVLSWDLAMLSVHLRTVKEMSKVDAHYEYIADIVRLCDEVSPKTKLVINGDILTRQQGEALCREHGADGYMIGRGIFQNPFAFSVDNEWEDMSPGDKLRLYQRHVELFAATWEAGSRPIAPLNKFCKTYLHGFDGAKEIRTELMACKDLTELRQKITHYLKTVAS